MFWRTGQEMSIDKGQKYSVNPSFKITLLHPKYLFTWLSFGILFMLSFLPLNLQLNIGKLLGVFLHLVSPNRRKIAETNLKLCFPEKSNEEIRDLVLNNFKNIGIGTFEIALAWWSSDRKIRNLNITFKNKELFEKAEREGKGMLVLARHSTHIELDARLLCLDLNFGGMFKEQTNQVFNYLMIRSRNKYAQPVFTNHEGRIAINSVRDDVKLIYASDQDYGKEVSEFIPFYKIKAATVSLPAHLSKSGIKVALVDIRRKKNGYVLEAFELPPCDNEYKFLLQMNQYYEKIISKAPEQFLWMHRRFKTRPSGKKSFYSKWKKRDRRREKIRNKRN